MNEPIPNVPMIEVHVCRIIFRDGAPQQYIHLKESAGKRTFAIVIGGNEAMEIYRVVHSQEMARPLTHQLAFNLVDELDWDIAGVDIVNLRKNTFYAEVALRQREGEGTRRVDARPSDAIALALRADCPIRVAEPVLEQVRIDKAPDLLPDPPDEPPASSEPDDTD